MNKPLPEIAGLPVDWNTDALTFDERLAVKETKARLRGQLRPVLTNDAACEPADGVQYWMYNGISLPEHAQTFAELGIQYELTLLYPRWLGAERSKTLGHIHTYPPEGKINYAEVCEVLSGEAIFVFQTLDVENRRASFCQAVRASAGEKVVFPPKLHHFTINAGDDVLLFADLISVHARGNYDGLSAMRGGAYRYGSDWTLNSTYEYAAPLVVREAEDYSDRALTRDVPLYELIWRAPEQLRWLNEPESFSQCFPELAANLPPHLLG
jgi:glucose-6-phosphate isomerase